MYYFNKIIIQLDHLKVYYQHKLINDIQQVFINNIMNIHYFF